MDPDDTIVAISSPPGAGVRGIVRLSGPNAVAIGDDLFEAEMDGGIRLREASGNRHVSGSIRIGPHRLPAAVYLFLSPRSYTRQDIVEFHLLGAPAVLGWLLEECLRRGARRAEPGEFTARAFLSGALDFSQVHGVAGTIAARSDLQLQAAQRLLHGALGQAASAAREELADLLSLVEGALDFADEPVAFITAAELKRRLAVVRDALAATSAAGLRSERWGQLPQVVLAGPPNVGKSSLLNRLTGLDRAICAPLAGTTRDVLSAPLRIGASECLLIDMAGLAGDVERSIGCAEGPGDGTDQAFQLIEGRTGGVERPARVIDEGVRGIEDGTAQAIEGRVGGVEGPDAEAQRAARQAIRDADMILHVFDITQPETWHIGGLGLDAARYASWETRLDAAEPSSLEKRPPKEGASETDALEGSDVPRLLVFNKADLTPAGSTAAKAIEDLCRRTGLDAVATSATTGLGCEALVGRIESMLQGRPVARHDGGIALVAEHRQALQDATEAIERAIQLTGVSGGDEDLQQAELVAAELHAAADALGTLVGQEDVEERLGRVFSRFCIGK